MKTCSKCKKEQELNCFGKDNHRPDKINPTCKSCKSKAYQNRKARYQAIGFVAAEKTCGTCKTVKSSDQFFKCSGSKSGLVSECVSCHSLRAKIFYEQNKNHILLKNQKYHAKNKDHITTKSFIRTIRRKYNLSYDEYMSLKDAQEFKCKICKTEEESLNVRLNLDHCHKSGKIRGFLCNKCNVGLGAFNDDKNLFLKALDYLKENQNDN